VEECTKAEAGVGAAIAAGNQEKKKEFHHSLFIISVSLVSICF